MSDKTRKLADEALIERRYQEQRARERLNPAQQLRCACGEFADVAHHEKGGRVTLYCKPCAVVAGILSAEGKPL